MVMFPKVRRFFQMSRKLWLLKKDGLSYRWSGKFNHISWPHHIIFIAGLPKSGTTWLAQLLEQVPGYKSCVTYDPDDCLINHDICEDVFSHIPREPYYVIKYHTRYTPENKAVLDKFDLRTIIMYRDLRDQAVSRYFHVMNDPTHRHHAYYNSTSKTEGMTHNIQMVTEDYLPWIRDWRAIIEQQPERFHEVRYESLRQNPSGVLTDVLDFYGIELPRTEVEKIVKDVAAKTQFDLKENLRLHRGTARKGIVGDWRNHLEEEHILMFKETCGQFLVDLGYEQDLIWGTSTESSTLREGSNKA